MTAFSLLRALVGRVSRVASDPRCRSAQKPRRTFRVEVLEDRALPSAYTVTDLGTFGGVESHAYSINAVGQVAGFATTADELPQAFVGDRNSIANLGTLGGDAAFAFGIDDKGRVVGTANTTDPDTVNGGQQNHAFLWDTGGMRDLGTVPGTINSEAWAINSRGQVVGWSYNVPPDWINPVTDPPNSHAFVWGGGKMTELELPEGMKNSFAGAINESGVIAGNAADSKSLHAIVWQKGKTGMYAPLDLGFPAGYGRSSLRGINDAGDVVGDARLIGGSGHAVWWHRDGHGGYAALDLGTLGGPGSGALDINNRNQIVGRSGTAGGIPHAFVYDSTGMHDLNDLIPIGSDWVLDTARSVNDRGQIVGVGIHHGEYHAFLLNPADDRLTPAPGGGKVLHVRGSNRADTISVVGLGADKGVGDSVEVTLNGTTTTYGHVIGIIVDAGLGTDLVSVSGTWRDTLHMQVDLDSFGYSHPATQQRVIEPAFGDVAVRSNDRLRSSGGDSLVVEDCTFFTPLRFEVRGGAGNDVVVCGCDSWNGPVLFEADLGSGDDVVTFEENTFAERMRLSLNAGSGNDTATYDSNSWRGPVTLEADLGSGDDLLDATENTFDEDVQLTIKGGSGHDDIVMKENTGDFHLDLDAGAGDDNVALSIPQDPCIINVRLGAGNDTGNFTFGPWDNIADPHRILIDAGAGDDTVAVEVIRPKGNEAPLDLLLRGGAGNDDLTLQSLGDPSALAKFRIDGGAGFDIARFPVGTVLRNCEKVHPEDRGRDFSIVVRALSVNLRQGGSVGIPVSTDVTAGAEGSVALSISGLPVGVTASFRPATIPTTGDSLLTLTAGPDAPLGTFRVLVTGTSGGIVHSVSLSVTVTPPPASADFSLMVRRPSLMLRTGSTATVAVITSGNFDGSVSLSVSGLPRGVAALFFPPRVTVGDDSLLLLTVDRDASPGTFLILVTGTSGSITHSTSLSLTVTPGSA